MNAQLAVLLGMGIYLLLGLLVVALRWRYGIIRAMGESIASQYGVPPERVRMALPIYVLIWPLFLRGIFSDRARIAKIRKTWNDRVSKCECGGMLSVDDAQIREAMWTGEVRARCGSCDRGTISKLDIQITWMDE